MERGILPVEDTEPHRELLVEAAEQAAARDATLLAVRFLDDDEYDERLDTLESVGRVENVEYDTEAVLDGVATDTKALIREVYDDAGLDVETEVFVAVADEDDRATKVVETAAERGCDHAFVVGAGRSPTGKALFGDTAQRVILEFDGFVTSLVD